MISTTPLRSRVLRSRPQSSYICWSCQQKRAVSTTWNTKQKEAKEQWATFATEIRAKKRKSMLSILEERGFIHAIAGERNAVDKLMIDKRIGVYCGVDPTAASLHVGHMLPFMALFWMHIHGFHTVSLIGGATGAIGDPTGRTTDRPLMTSTERKANITAIQYQLKRVWLNLEVVAKNHGYPYEKYWRRAIDNNSTWWSKVTFLEVLKLLGRGLRLGPMLTRDTVKTKMESGDGMSFSEFCYPILQGWDWWHMYNSKGIQMQIGGSDQFGNIVSGIESVKYIAKNHPDPDVRQEGGVHELNTPYGFTVPLLTTASGAKFGKSAGNAIWLDQQMTSSFDLYGFFVRTADADVERYLKLFTFLTLSEIQSLMAQHQNAPSKRIPHHKLAHEFVSLVHSDQAATDAAAQHSSMFTKPSLTSMAAGVKEPKTNPLLTNQNPATRASGLFTSNQVNKYAEQTNAQSAQNMNIVLPKSLIYDQPIARVLFAAGLVTSRSEGHRLAEGTGAYIGCRSAGNAQMSDDVSFVPAKPRDPMQTWNYVIKDSDAGVVQEEGEEGLLILRVGKWKVRIVRIVSDEKYEKMNIPNPPAGWLEMKAQLTAAGQKMLFESSGAKKKLEERGQMLEARRRQRDDNASGQPIDDNSADSEELLDLVQPDHDKPKRQRNLEGYQVSQESGAQYMRDHLPRAGTERPPHAGTERPSRAGTAEPSRLRIKWQGNQRNKPSSDQASSERSGARR